jgi:hypothetical protein
MSVVLYHATLKHYSKPASQDSIHHHEQKEVDIGAAEQQHHQKKVGLKNRRASFVQTYQYLI